MPQSVSTSIAVVKAGGAGPSPGWLGSAWPHPERQSPFWKAAGSRFFGVCSLLGAPGFNGLLGAGWFGSRRLALWLRGVTTTGAPRGSLLVLNGPPLFLQPLFPLLEAICKHDHQPRLTV